MTDSAPATADDVSRLVAEYQEERDWEEIHSHVSNTSDAVRKLTRAVIDSGDIDTEKISAIYHLCQHDRAYLPKTKMRTIEGMDIDQQAKEEIQSHIDDGTGIIGGGSYIVRIDGYEDETFALLDQLVNANDPDELEKVVKRFAKLKIKGVQTGKISPILYFLHPTVFPICNKKSREGMEKYFGHNISPNLSAYPKAIEQFRVVRDEFGFEDDFRDLDNFFNWVESDEESDERSAPTGVQPAEHYFWISANPSIWSVEDIEDGGTVFYTAYNRKLNKRRLFDAFEKASPGDKVLFYETTPVKAIVAEGIVVEGLHEEEHGEYEDPVEGITVKYERPVDEITWSQLTAVEDLEDSKPITNGAQGSLFEVTETEYETILALEEPDEPPTLDALATLQSKLEPIEVEFELPEELYFDDADALRREIEASLNAGKHIIFTGPPGTGKTKLTKELCRQSASQLEQVDGHTFSTATSEWTAFDTVGGYVPSRDPEQSNQELEFQPRLFLNCFRRETEGIVNRWLVIDEINRSDIDKAFGELFSVLSGDAVELPYERKNRVEIVPLDGSTSDEKLEDIAANPDAFPVAPSWRLLATMNTYDKASLYEMSYAFMRRFNFVYVGIPDLEEDGRVRASLLDPDVDDNFASAWLADDPDLRPTLQVIYRDLAVIWKLVNAHSRAIGPSIVRDILDFSHAYGVGRDPSSAGDALTAVIVGLIYPQIEGLRPEMQRNLVRSFTGERETDRGPVSLELNETRLRSQAADYFDIRFDDE